MTKQIIFGLVVILCSCASLIQSDFIEAEKKPPVFSLKEGVQVWENIADFPFEKTTYIDSMKYVNGRTFKELEKQALSYAKLIKAHGIHIVDISRNKTSVKIDAGGKRPELIVNGFDLEEHGVGPDTLHFSKNVYSNAISFSIHVKFFVYNEGFAIETKE
jgi:hypothetical protein